DVPSMNLDRNNRITLVLQENKASWELANFIAEAINGVMVLSIDAEPIAHAVDQKNVIVQVPDEALPNLSSFITQIMGTTIDSEIASGGARVIINRAEGTIAMTRDVELSPVIISHKGMTIQIVTPEPEPDPNNPRVENVPFAVIDPDNRGGTGLRQLLDALNTLNVPSEDRIAIIKEIHDLGVLHAELIYK
ncbi:MAG: flagellar basal body P-ring protein FlgI, partial [Phycisphaeraceae bacterium]